VNGNATSAGDSASEVHVTQPDAVEVEVFRYACASVVDELEVDLTRTAYSPLIYEYKDYCVGVLTPGFELLTQSEGSLPMFLGTLGPQVRDCVELIGGENLEDGDVFVTNYAPMNGSHLNNTTCATPVFDGDEIVAYIAIRAHWADVGGIVPGSISWDARDIFQEGTQYRGLRVERAGQIVPEVLATIQANTRMHAEVTGDLMAQLAACRKGRDRWADRVSRRWRSSDITKLVEAQAELSRSAAERAVEALPDGEYEATCRLDDSGIVGTEPLPLTVKLIVQGRRMTVDFSQMPPQVPAPINAGRICGAVASARLAFKQMLVPERPADEWLFGALDVTIPDGTVLSATGDAPMAWWSTIPGSVIDLIFRAVGSRFPELVPAGHHATMGGFVISGLDAQGHRFLCMDTALGGFGGNADADGYGPLKTLMHSDNKDIAAEIMEAGYPLRVVSNRLRREAAGRGLHRGGYGTEKIIEVLAPVDLGTSMDRTLDPPWGLAGGEPGVPGDFEILEPAAQGWRSVKKAASVPLDPGTLIRIRSAGGGGWGTPPRDTQEAVR
jgi:N-methylhydantoinase B